MAEAPDNDRLTESGQTFSSGQARTLLLACGALAREVLHLCQVNGWTHLDLQCLPAILHNTPDRITPAVENAIVNARERYDRIYVLYADCGTGGALERLCDRLGVEMLAGPHCYSFFSGNEDFAERAEANMRAFFLTDFLVRQFDAFVVRPLGLDRHPELRDAYFGNYEKLVYLAQTADPALAAKAQECANFLGLEYEHRKTGYGDLATSLGEWAGRDGAPTGSGGL